MTKILQRAKCVKVVGMDGDERHYALVGGQWLYAGSAHYGSIGWNFSTFKLTVPVDTPGSSNDHETMVSRFGKSFNKRNMYMREWYANK